MQIRRVLPKDAIQSIDEPTFDREFDGEPSDQLLVVEADDGPDRAYPILILNYHEIVNDAVDGDPIAVTWCPLCGSAVVYDRVVDGKELTFGVSGKLAEDDLVMYDRETDSEWKQSTGRCIDGTYKGRTLDMLPGAMMTYERFSDAHPEGRILQRPDGQRPVVIPEAGGGGLRTEMREIDYSVDHFAEYIESDWLGSRSRDEPRSWDRVDIGAKEVVLGIEVDDDALGIPHSRVEAVAHVSIGTTDAVVFAADGDLHAFEDPGIAFDAHNDGRVVGDGTEWDPATGESADGRSLTRLPARRLFAFAWQADHGPDAFYRPE